MKITLEAKEVTKTTEGYGSWSEYDKDSELEVSFEKTEDMIVLEFDENKIKVNVDDLLKAVRLVGDR